MIKALVIDDINEVAESLGLMLSLLDVSTTVAISLDAALVAIRDQPPDIIFLDLNMPGVSGFDLLAYLNSVLKLNTIPIVVVTSDDQKTTIERAYMDGALSVIIKPVSFDMLERSLKAARLRSTY